MDCFEALGFEVQLAERQFHPFHQNRQVNRPLLVLKRLDILDVVFHRVLVIELEIILNRAHLGVVLVNCINLDGPLVIQHQGLDVGEVYTQVAVKEGLLLGFEEVAEQSVARTEITYFVLDDPAGLLGLLDT